MRIISLYQILCCYQTRCRYPLAMSRKVPPRRGLGAGCADEWFKKRAAALPLPNEHKRATNMKTYLVTTQTITMLWSSEPIKRSGNIASLVASAAKRVRIPKIGWRAPQHLLTSRAKSFAYPCTIATGRSFIRSKGDRDSIDYRSTPCNGKSNLWSPVWCVGISVRDPTPQRLIVRRTSYDSSCVLRSIEWYYT